MMATLGPGPITHSNIFYVVVHILRSIVFSIFSYAALKIINFSTSIIIKSPVGESLTKEIFQALNAHRN